MVVSGAVWVAGAGAGAGGAGVVVGAGAAEAGALADSGSSEWFFLKRFPGKHIQVSSRGWRSERGAAGRVIYIDRASSRGALVRGRVRRSVLDWGEPRSLAFFRPATPNPLPSTRNSAVVRRHPGTLRAAHSLFARPDAARSPDPAFRAHARRRSLRGSVHGLGTRPSRGVARRRHIRPAIL